MRTVKLVIGFDGTRYEGWQSQKNCKTLQEVFEKALSQILKEKKVDLIGSSRTDSGVHAKGFVAHFKTQSALKDPKIKDALNYYLPRDILVYSAETVPAVFHARYLAKSKIYQYDIWRSKTRPLFEAPFALWYPHALNLSKMKQAARHLVGRHDFSAFYDKGGDLPKSAVRSIRRISIKKDKSQIRIQIEGDGFLRHMVRVIVGTLIDVGRGKLPARTIPGVLTSKDRSKAGPTAKPHGLTLLRVKY